MNKKKKITKYQCRVYLYLMIHDPSPVKKGFHISKYYRDENNSNRYDLAIKKLQKDNAIIDTKEGIRINPNTENYDFFRFWVENLGLQKAISDNLRMGEKIISKEKRTPEEFIKDLLTLGEYSKKNKIAENFISKLITKIK
jgi:hypothetical protein